MGAQHTTQGLGFRVQTLSSQTPSIFSADVPPLPGGHKAREHPFRPPEPVRSSTQCTPRPKAAKKQEPPSQTYLVGPLKPLKNISK